MSLYIHKLHSSLVAFTVMSSGCSLLFTENDLQADARTSSDARIGGAQTIDVSIAKVEDDGEEDANRNVKLAGNFLDLVTVNGERNLVAMRFTDLAIPQGAEILQANIYFTTSRTSTEPTTVQILAEQTPQSPLLSTTNGDLSRRLDASTSMVSWTIAPWAEPDQSESAQISPDISLLLYELVQLPTWKPEDNAVTLLLRGCVSCGYRSAYGFGSNPTGSGKLPRLRIVFR